MTGVYFWLNILQMFVGLAPSNIDYGQKTKNKTFKCIKLTELNNYVPHHIYNF